MNRILRANDFGWSIFPFRRTFFFFSAQRGINLIISLLCFLPACAPLITATPPPTPQIMVVSRSPALLGWESNIYGCAQNFPQLSIFIIESTPGSFPSVKSDFFLKLGDSSTPAANSYLITWDDILIIANVASPIDELSLSQLQNIYIHPGINPPNIDSSITIHPWTYPAEDEVRTIFDQALNIKENLPVHAFIATDPSVMIEAISVDPNAIGYLPGSALSLANPDQQSLIKILKPDPTQIDYFRLPVIAIFPAKPTPLQNALIQCLSKNPD